MSKIVIFLTMVLAVIVVVQTESIAADATINAKETHQTMEGFGASIAWGADQLAAHPRREEIYGHIFDDLGLDILRLRNTYRDNPANFAPGIADIVQALYNHAPNPPKILISSWSPPYNLKSNNSVNGGNNATLRKDAATGQYIYGSFARYWVDALQAYKSIGVEPDFISIQNEPSFDASWESCRLQPSENPQIAGYKQALDSVYYALQAADLHPKFLASEGRGIGYNTFQNYAQQFNHNLADGYAFHLYHGESDNVSDNHNPDLFNANLRAIANVYKTKPIFQTEYDRGDWFNSVWLIQNCLITGNLSGYLWWELVWGSGGKPLVEMLSSIYTITKYYWGFRQYSKFIDSGWKRVTATATDDSLRISAFINPDGNKLTCVILNIGRRDREMGFDFQNFAITSGSVVRTSATEDGVEINSNYDGTVPLGFPARSITTLSFSGTLTSIDYPQSATPHEFALQQNYPNPFNPVTTISFSLPVQAKVTVEIFNQAGQNVAILADGTMSAGDHQVTWNAERFPSGIFFCRLTADGKRSFAATRKLILVK